MTRFKTIGSLQLHEDLAHERREWKLQRVGWALMALALLAAVLGLFGHGPLSETASASAGGALTVRHQRFERYQAPSEYDIGAMPALAAGGVLVLRVEPALLARIEIERFEPAPQQVRADGEALLFAFATVPGKPARVRAGRVAGGGVGHRRGAALAAGGGAGRPRRRRLDAASARDAVAVDGGRGGAGPGVRPCDRAGVAGVAPVPPVRTGAPGRGRSPHVRHHEARKGWSEPPWPAFSAEPAAGRTAHGA